MMNKMNPAAPRIPFWLKLAYSAFMAVLVPVYWVKYGPTNFVYFCDLALFLTLVGIWTEHPLPASMAAVGIVLPQMLWCVDFFAHFFGLNITGMTSYMFDSNRSLFLRGLSLFHGWLPFLLLFLVVRLGYDRRALLAWTVTAWTAMLAGYFLLPAPGATLDNPLAPVNINYVYGLSDAQSQTWVHPLVWLLLMLTALPLLIFIPTHFLLSKTCRKAAPLSPGKTAELANTR
jgi:hypothetical protein